jgi:DNA-binding FadR family transcriptional regulator
MSAQIRLVLLKHRLWDPEDHRKRSVSWHEKIVDSLKQRNLQQSLEELQAHMAASQEWLQKSSEFREEN